LFYVIVAVNSRIIDSLPPKFKAKVLEKISERLPLHVTANLIHDEGYWKRCCKSRWEICDVVQYGGSWKRMFFERYVELEKSTISFLYEEKQCAMVKC